MLKKLTLISFCLFSCALFGTDNRPTKTATRYGICIHLEEDAFPEQFEKVCTLTSIDSPDSFGIELATGNLVLLVENAKSSKHLIELLKKEDFEAKVIEVKLDEEPDANVISLNCMYEMSQELDAIIQTPGSGAMTQKIS